MNTTFGLIRLCTSLLAVAMVLAAALGILSTRFPPSGASLLPQSRVAVAAPTAPAITYPVSSGSPTQAAHVPSPSGATRPASGSPAPGHGIVLYALLAAALIAGLVLLLAAGFRAKRHILEQGTSRRKAR